MFAMRNGSRCYLEDLLQGGAVLGGEDHECGGIEQVVKWHTHRSQLDIIWSGGGERLKPKRYTQSATAFNMGE